MIVNKKIATYFKAIRILYIVSLVCSALSILSQGIDRAVTGQWYLWQDLSIGNRLSEGFDKNLIFAHLMGIWLSPFLMIVFTWYESRMISRIDSAKLYEYIDIKSSNDLQNVKIQFLDNKDRLLICCQLLLDFCVAFFFAMFCSAFLLTVILQLYSVDIWVHS